MTFDSIPEGTAFVRNAVYEENGIRAVCYSDYSSFSDGLNGFATTPLYFHGTDHFIEFSLVNGDTFNLTSFWLTSNGYADRWIQTSKNASKVSLGMPTTPTLKTFSGTNYTGITWFRIGTPWYATEVDTITVDDGIINAPPTDFSLVSPSNGTEIYTTSPMLDWASAGGATSFELFLGEADPPPHFATTTASNSEAAATGLLEHTTYHWYVVASNQYGTSRAPASGSWNFAILENSVILVSNTVINAGDATYDEQKVVVNGCTLTVNGSHSFSNLHLINGAKLTHSAATTGVVYGVDLAVGGTLSVSSNSSIDVSGRGYLAGRTEGNTTNGVSSGFAGGSYGGAGANGGANAYLGVVSGSANMLYGDFRNPVCPGSGGARVNAGGGLVRITADSFLLDGQILANGAGGTYYGSGGSGGGVYLNTRILGGAGSMAANGGAGYTSDSLGGGGGGRIAVYYETNSGFDLTNQLAVLAGSGGGGIGTPGTIYLKPAGDVGTLVVAGPDNPLNRNTPIWIPEGTNYEENILIQGTNRVGELWSETITPLNLQILSGGKLTHRAATTNTEYKLVIWVQSNLVVDATSLIDVSGQGYSGGRTLGNSTIGASTGAAGASYGGRGEEYSPGVVNWVYGDPRNPNEPGSGSGPYGNGGRKGGGLVRIQAGILTLNGFILANGESDGSWGGGSGGGVFLDVGSITGGGAVQAKGGAGGPYGGCGGGGRVAVCYGEFNGFDLTNQISVAGGGRGSTPQIGSPGTIYLKKNGQIGELLIDGKNTASTLATPLWLPAGATYAERITLSGTGLVVDVCSENFAPTNLLLKSGVKLSHSASTSNAEHRLVLSVPGTLRIDASSSIDVSGKGYAPTKTLGNTTLGAATGRAGGSYGGLGGSGQGTPNTVYGDFRNPNELGSGCGIASGSGGSGGGLIHLEVDRLELEGSINANGTRNSASGGSGGAIWLRVGTLVGSGIITALGGDGYSLQSSGGGGRIAVNYGEFDGFDPVTQISACGGIGGAIGSAGTIYLKHGDEDGELVVANNGVTGRPVTPLWIPEGIDAICNMTIRGTGQVVEIWSERVVLSNLTLQSGATLSHPAATTNAEYDLKLYALGTVTVDGASAIDASGKGYLPGRTLGNTTLGGATGRGGGSYGGMGGNQQGTPGAPYGDSTQPNELGSGGGNQPGGGLIRLTAPRLIVDGRVKADGANGSLVEGAGSGGGIYLDVENLSGTGVVHAAGGSAGGYGSGGGGGRVAVYYGSVDQFDLPDGVTAAGGTGAGPGSPGPVYLENHIAPVSFNEVRPNGCLMGPVNTIWIECGNPLKDLSFTLDDVSLTGPLGPVSLVSLDQTGWFDYELTLATPATDEGTYRLEIGTNIQSIFGGAPLGVVTNTFILDHTAPAAPVATNYLAPPMTNLLKTTEITLRGTRENGSSVWRDSSQLVALGDWSWSAGVTLTQGLNTVSLHARDVAGNRSATNAWLFLADTVSPVVFGVSPANNAVVTSTPAIVRMTFMETSSGLDVQRSSFSLKKSGIPVPGPWVATADTVTLTPEGLMVDGTYAVAATLIDNLSNTGTFSSVFTVDTTPPAPPILNPITTPTTINQQTITGTRETGTYTYVYRGETMYGSQYGGTTWGFAVPLTNGWNHWGFTAVDSAGNQSLRTNISILYNNVAPVPVTVTGQVAGVGTQITLGWSGYDELAAGGDITSYQVYQSDSGFTHVSQAALIGTRPTWQKNYEVSGLVRGETKHYAVTARDTTGLCDSNVTSVALAPVDAVAPPNPTGAVFVCQGTDLTVRWSPSADPHADLTGYRVYVTNEATGASLPPTTNEYLKIGLEESKSYLFRIAAYDLTGNEGSGLVVTGYTLLPNPIGLVVTPYDGFVSLSWSGVTPATNVGGYALYAQTNAYAGVEGLTRRLLTTGTSAQVAGFVNGVTNWFAVTTVNRSGGEDPAVTPVTAATVEDEWGPELLNLKWQGGAASGPATWPGRFTVQAQDPIGVSRVEFWVNGTELPGEASGTTNFAAFWDVSRTTNDGPHELVVKGYDTKGNSAAITQSVTVALALPPAPVITSPLGTTVVSRTWQSVSGTGAVYATEVRWSVNGYCTATSAPSASGAFSATLDLQQGTNRITAAAVNRAGAREASNSASVILDPSVPAAPVGFTAAAQANGAIRVSWSDPLGINIKGYHVYRASVPFTSKVQASRMNTSLVATRVFSDLPTADGTYYYRVTAVNQADAEGPLSAEASTTSDRVAPKVLSISYATDGEGGAAEGRFGRGTVTVDVTLSEGLQTAPFFSLNPVNGTPISPTLNKVSETQYRGSFAVTTSSPCGTAYATFSGRDAVGNRGTEIQSGAQIELDVCGPVLTELNVSPGTPIRNSAENPTTVTVVAVFPAGGVPVQTPVLKWSLSQTHPAETAVTLSPLTAQSWSGSVTLPAGAGQPAEYLDFSYAGLDTLGNTGRMIAAESRFETYQGGLPPLDAPGGLTGRALPGGEVALIWQAVSLASDYAVFKGPASNGVGFVMRSGGGTNYAEAAENETNWYAVASVREANGQVTTGALSAAVQVAADATAPGAPSGLTLTLLGSGVKASWQAPGGETVKYAAYRSGNDFTNTGGLVAKATNLSATTWTDPNPVTGSAYYGLVAEDAAGNRSPLSARAYTNLALLPVNSLQVRKTWGALPMVSWSHGQVSEIDGYNLYAGEQGAETLLNGELGSTATQHVDTSYAGGSKRYAIAAVDVQGGVEAESFSRDIILPDLMASLPTNTVILRGVMNRLEYGVANMGATAVTGAKLYARFLGVDHVSEPFNLEAGAQATVAVVVGGYANLGSRVVVSNRVELAPNAGELAVLSATNEVEVGTGMLVAEVLNDELTRGTEGKVRFALRNTSSEEVEVVLAQGGGASPEVRVKLEDADGMVYANTAAQQVLGGLVLTVANGQTVARIPAGESFTSADILLPVPTNVPNAVVLRLEIDRLHYHVAREDHVQISGLQSMRAVTLAETRYYAEVTNVTPAVSFGGTNILIQGRSVNRASGQAEQNAQVKLVVSVDGFERTYTPYSDGTGSWSYTFVPLAGEVGAYRVWAVHPSVVAKPEQATFTIARVGVSPAVANLKLPRAYEYTLPVTVTASKGNPLTNVVLSCTAADQPGGTWPAGIAVVATAQVAGVQGGQSAALSFRLQGDATAASTGQVLVVVKSAGGPTGGWGTVTVNYQLHTALPMLQWTPNYVQTGVAISNSEMETVVLKNVGYAALEGVTLALLDTNGLAAPGWVRLNVSTNAGALAVGEERAVPLVFAPTSGVSETLHEFRLQVRASNHATQNINLFAGVDGSGLGGALFKVTDIYTGTTNQQGGLIQGLAGATLTLQKESGSQVVTSRVSDALGEAQFADLPVGSYIVRVSASKHDTYGGRLWVKPGVVTVKEVFLPYNLVTVEWTVVPTTIQDQYEVVLTATFETAVPAPVVVIEPTSVALPDMKAGEVLNVEMRIVNHGLIRAENMVFTPPASDEHLRFELLTAVPATLEAKQVVTIPYRITCLKSLSGDAADAGGGGSAFCGTRCASASYDHTCPNGYRASGRSAGGCVTRACSGSSQIGLIGGGTVNFGLSGGGGGGSSGSPGATSLPQGKLGCAPGANPEEDPCCPTESTGSDVVLAGGEFHDEAVDLEINTLGDLLKVRRFFFNRAWAFDGLGDTLDFTYEGDVAAVASLAGLSLKRTGVETALTPGVRFYSDAGDMLECRTNGFHLESTSGDWAEFDLGRRQVAKGDRQGRQLLYGYDSTTSRVVGVYDHFTNQVLWVAYTSAGLISNLSDRATGGRQVTYRYDASGHLTNVVGVRGEQTSYAYDASGRMVAKHAPGGFERRINYRVDGAILSVVDADGRGKFFDFSYDESTGEYYSYVRTSGGQILERWYDGNWSLTRAAINGTPVDTGGGAANPDGSREDYNEDGQVVRREYLDGSSRQFEYNGPYRAMTRMVDESGAVTLYQRDARGNVTSLVEAAGTALERTTVNTYDNLGLLLRTVRSGDSNTPAATVMFTYDEKGNIRSQTGPEGHATCYTYDDLGHTATISNENGEVWAFTYDAMGNRLTTRDPLGLVESNTYDDAGNLTQLRDVNGRVYQYEYNGEGWLARATDPFGMVQENEYDDDGQLLAARYSDGEVFSASYRWDGQMKSLADFAGRANRTDYDELGRVAAMTTPDGETASLEYDEADRIIRIYSPVLESRYAYNHRGAVTGLEYQTTGLVLTNRFAYDRLGRMTSAVDGEGHRRQWEYDALGRQIQAVDSLGGTNRYEYDAHDNLVGLTDARGQTTRFEYDSADRLLRRRFADGADIRLSYDAAGRVVQTVDANGSMVRWSYDGLGHVLTTRVYAAETNPLPVKTVQYTYDADGRRLSYDDGTTSGLWEYDDSNRTAKCTVDYGAFSASYEYAYDVQRRKVRFVGPGGWTNLYHYGADRLLSGVEIPGEGSLGLQRTAYGLEQQIQYPGGARQSYLSDPLLGVLTNRVVDAAQVLLMDQVHLRNRAKVTTELDTEESACAYQYDGNYQLRGAADSVLGAAEYTYDAAGNRATSTGADAGAWQHDEVNRLTNSPVGDFAYDAAGNMTRRSFEGETRFYVYEPAGNLAEIRDGEGQVLARYYYDPFGRRLKKEVNGQIIWFLYADEGLIAEIDENGTVIRQYGYFPDATWNNNPITLKTGGQVFYFLNDVLGTPRKLLTQNGTVVWSALYEAFGAAHIATNAQIENPLRGSGQYHDAESGLHYNTGRYYDPRLGRYIQTDPLGEAGGANLYAFAQNSPIQYVDPRGLVIVIDNRKTSTGGDKKYRTTFGPIPIIPQLWGAFYSGPPENRYDSYISPEDRARLKAKASKGVVIFIHGYHDPYENSMKTARMMENTLKGKLVDPDFEMVSFAWQGDFGALNFKGSKAIARDAAESLSRIAECLEKAGIPVMIMPHSLGNYVAAESILKHGDTEYDTWIALQAAVAARDMTKKGRYGKAIENQVGTLQYTSGKGDIITGPMIFGLSEGAIGVGNIGIKNAPSNASRIDYKPTEHGDIWGAPIQDAAAIAIQRMRRTVVDTTERGRCWVLDGEGAQP